MKRSELLVFLLLAVSLLSACAPADTATSGKLKVVATTTILGDVVGQIGGEWIELRVLLPAGSDPHSFQPAPKDLVVVADANLIFANGLGLEEFLAAMLTNAAEGATMVAVSEGLEALTAADDDAAHAGDVDPHVWMDVNNVIAWAEQIADALATADPANAAAYRANAAAYIEQLHTLDAWIIEQVAQLPAERRVLVTDHEALSYFAARYGFNLIGTVTPGYSTLAESSAQQLAELEDWIGQYAVPAVFVGAGVNPALAERLAGDTGVELVVLYTGTLSAANGPASTYLDLMRYDVGVIVGALE